MAALLILYTCPSLATRSIQACSNNTSLRLTRENQVDCSLTRSSFGSSDDVRILLFIYKVNVMKPVLAVQKKTGCYSRYPSVIVLVRLLLLILVADEAVWDGELLPTTHALSVGKIPISSSSTSLTTRPLQSIERSQLVFLDGGEWTSVLQMLRLQDSSLPATKYGYMKIVTGRMTRGDDAVQSQSQSQSSQRVIAMEAYSNQNHHDSSDNLHITVFRCWKRRVL